VGTERKTPSYMIREEMQKKKLRGREKSIRGEIEGKRE